MFGYEETRFQLTGKVGSGLMHTREHILVPTQCVHGKQSKLNKRYTAKALLLAQQPLVHPANATTAKVLLTCPVSKRHCGEEVGPKCSWFAQVLK